MKNFAAVRSIDLQYAHRVMRHGGHCATLHGHRGTIEVTVVGQLSETGEETDMVVDFGAIEDALLRVKNMLCHTTILERLDPMVALFRNIGEQQLGLWDMVEDGGEKQPIFQVNSPLINLVVVPFAPTAERLAQLTYCMLRDFLNRRDVTVQSVTFWETAKSRATYPVC